MAKKIASLEEVQEQLTDLRRKQVVAEQNLGFHKAEADKYKMEIKSIVAEIGQVIDGRHQQKLPFTSPPKAEAPKGNTYDVHQDGTVELRAPAEKPMSNPPTPAAASADDQASIANAADGKVIPVPEDPPVDGEPKKRKRRTKAEMAAAASAEAANGAATIEVKTDGTPELKAPPHQNTYPNPGTNRPTGDEWKTKPIDGNLIGLRPNDIFALEDAGIKNLGQAANMIDSGLLSQAESVSKATADRLIDAMQKWFVLNS